MKKLSAKQKEDQEKWRKHFRRGLSQLSLTQSKTDQTGADTHSPNWTWTDPNWTSRWLPFRKWSKTWSTWDGSTFPTIPFRIWLRVHALIRLIVVETLPALTALNASKNNISYLNYKLKSKRTAKKGTLKKMDDQDEEDPPEPVKWSQLKYANLSFNRILEITKFEPRKLVVNWPGTGLVQQWHPQNGPVELFARIRDSGLVG